MKRIAPTPYKYHVFVSFSDLFPEEEVPSVIDIIKHYPRSTIIQVYELIIQELEGKIIGLHDNHKGIGQLAGHLKSIREGHFNWERVSPGKKVYPVLILSDPNIIQEGLYGIVSDRYEETLRNNHIRSIAANRPLVLMSVFTLYKYSNLFQKKGFAYYFEHYYSFLKISGEKEVSFDQYMGWQSFNIKKQIGDIIADLKKQNDSPAVSD